MSSNDQSDDTEPEPNADASSEETTEQTPDPGEGMATPSERPPARPMSRTVLLVAGVLVGLLGLVAIFTPYVTGIAFTFALGVILLAGAIVHVVSAFSGRGWRGFVFQVLLAVLYGLAGLALLSEPVVGLVTLTLLLVAYLFVEGIVEIVLGFRLRPGASWGWMVVSGVFSLVLAVLLLAGFPGTASWALGLLVGLSLLSTGLSLVLLGIAVGSEPTGLGQPAGEGGSGPG